MYLYEYNHSKRAGVTETIGIISKLLIYLLNSDMPPSQTEATYNRLM